MQSFRVILIVPDLFAGLLKSFTTLCACTLVSNMSVWLSSVSGPSTRNFGGSDQ